MRLLHRLTAAVFLPLPLLVGCDGDGPDTQRFRAVLSGQNEVPARQTPASGSAEFEVAPDNTIQYTLDVSNLSNITAAHIHGPASATANAGVIVGLCCTQPPTGQFSGRLAEGTITATTAEGIGMDSLLVLMQNGNAYVNVHTNDGVAPTNTGPGDFPGGEIRGQILPE